MYVTRYLTTIKPNVSPLERARKYISLVKSAGALVLMSLCNALVNRTGPRLIPLTPV